jgi:hypothetical protein
MDILDIISAGFATGQDFEVSIDYNKTRPVITTTYPIDFSGTRHLNFGNNTKVTKDFVFRAESATAGRSTINSSNVFILRYFHNSERLRVTFRNGARYEYENVSETEWVAIRSGLASCKTSGQNQWGRWFQGKIPSLGAAVFRYLKQAGKPYRRL